MEHPLWDIVMTVVKSINDVTGSLCVDIISNGQGKFSFKSFRRDPEDNSGWYPCGPESDFLYNSSQEAHRAARKVVAWLERD